VPETIRFLLVCPVFFIFGCGREASPAAWTASDQTEVGFAVPGPLYNVIIPDSLTTTVLWGENYPLLVNTAAITDAVLTGDTVISGAEPFLSLERERVIMEHSIAVAMGDSIAGDSLQAYLADSSFLVFVTSPASGRIRILTGSGSTIQPGDRIALITGPPPDSLYILSPEYSLIRWPLNIPGCTVTDRGLQCTGAWPGEEAALPGTWSLRQQFIHEDGLRSYLLSTPGDTLPIIILGSTDTSKIIYSGLPLDSIPLLGWN
jgi:hypothetical protein